MAKEDIIGITVNGETVANFSIPVIGYNVKLDEYRFTHVGGVHEFSVALIRDTDEAIIPKKEVPLEIIPPVEIPLKTTPQEDPIVPLAVPPKKTRKPREPKVEAPTVVVEDARAPEEPKNESIVPPAVSGNVDSARLQYLAKMIGFYMKAKGLKPGDITIKMIIDEAPDIIEKADGTKDNNETIQSAIDSLKM